MILDRSPEDEPLIPADRTKIRLEMSRSKTVTEKRNRACEGDHLSYAKQTSEDILEWTKASEPQEELLASEECGRKVYEY